MGGIGLALGSFLNVVVLRYQGDAFLFSPRVAGGRSRCPHCKTDLRWFELIPILSFLFLKAKCRTCREKISFQYPAVELLSAILFLISYALVSSGSFSLSIELTTAILLGAVLWMLLLVALIDMKLRIIPDEANLFILASGVIALFAEKGLGVSFFPRIWEYGDIFGSWSPLTVHLLGMFAGLLFFVILLVASRGKAMGMGDVKLAAALGFLFGWPDILFITILSFLLGGGWGGVVLFRKTHTMKSAVPFGPFLALAAVLVVFFGRAIAQAYFITLPGFLFL